METTDSPDGADGSNATTPAPPSETTDPTISPAEVRERLDRVTDPELDRSIVDLQYIDAIDIEDGTVTVTFVLPTAWCSPAFAWMMATGIRDEVGSLPAVGSVTVRLSDHMHGDEITTGVNQGMSFESVFEEADDGIEAVQRKLDRKARFARQHTAIEALRGAGLGPYQIALLRRTDVDLDYRPERAAVHVRDGALTVTVDREPLAAYAAKARATGLVTDETDRLFADREGEPLDPEPDAFEATLRDARLAGANIDGQATICEALHESRNGVSFD
jgi:metal-sulfur cluster biosynthetic enzyme